MKIHRDVQQGTEEWQELRRGRITGSKLKGIVVRRGDKRKVGFYELMAERLGVFEDGEEELTSDRERGSSLEAEAREHFVKRSRKKVEEVGFITDGKNPYIALSPDGIIKGKGGKYTEAVEIKCLSAARHLQAYFEKAVPGDYDDQVTQYFVVMPDLKKLHFVFYDPRITVLPYHVIEVERDDVMEANAIGLREYQEKTLREIDEMIASLAF